MPDNPNFDWLTYETEFNQGRFKRPKGQFETHLYCLPRNEVIVWFRDGIDDDTVKALSAAFFPDEANALEHRDASAGSWPWKAKGERTMPPATPQEVPLRIGPGSVLHAPARVVLPYNEIDNDEASLALGTGLFPLPLHGKGQDTPVPQRRSPRPELLRPEHHWRMWRTASRSCVMRLEPLTGVWPARWRVSPSSWDLPQALEKERAAAWRFGWAGIGAGAQSGKQVWEGNPAPDQAHHLAADQLRHDFSVKTGVSHVGKELQQDKQRIDGNWLVACLRSDYLRHMQKEAPALDTDLAFVTELLTIAEREERPHHEKGGWREWQRDGVQVRDLAPLLEGAKAGKMYIPPLSIPFVGLNEALERIDFATRTDEFRDLREDRWSDFWKAAWASLLGRAKALLLVRYALQSINPHTQNFLLELEQTPAGWASTGRLIVRDVQDTAIHREAAWALHGRDKGKVPPAEPDLPEVPPPRRREHPLCDAFTLEVLNHEFGPAREYAQETGTQISKNYTYVGTQLLWRKFSQFGKDGQFNLEGERIYREGNAATIRGFVGPPPADAPAAGAGAGSNPIAQAAAKAAAKVRRAELEAERKASFIPRFGRWLEFRMAEWGLAHNRAYLHALEEALGHNFCVDWRALPHPRRPTGLDAQGDAAPAGGAAVAWEAEASLVVHAHLGTIAGQEQIRAYRDRKWKAFAPAVTLLLTAGGAPCPYRKIALQRLRPDPKTWVDLTDHEGKVFLYQGKADDYRYRLDLESRGWLELPRPGMGGTYHLVGVEAPRPPPPPRAPVPASSPAPAGLK